MWLLVSKAISICPFGYVNNKQGVTDGAACVYNGIEYKPAFLVQAGAC